MAGRSANVIAMARQKQFLQEKAVRLYQDTSTAMKAPRLIMCGDKILY